MDEINTMMIHKFLTVILISFFIVNCSNKDSLESNSDVLLSDIKYYSDIEEKLTLDQVRSGEFDSVFTKSQSPYLNIARTIHPVWIKIAYENLNTLSIYILELDFPHLEYVTLFYTDRSGHEIEIKNGLTVPIKEKQIKSGNSHFELNYLPEKGELYLRIQSRSGLVVPISLMERNQYIDKESKVIASSFMFYGWMLGIGVLNLFLFAFLLDRSYLYYSFYCFSIPLYVSCMDGLFFQYLLPNNYLLQQYAVYFFVIISACSGIKFTTSFLDSKKQIKSVRLIGNFLLVIWSIFAILPFFIDYTYYSILISASVIPTAVCLILLGIITLLNRFKSAILYLFSWTIVLSTIVYQALLVLGLIPVIDISFFMVKIGICLESVMFAVAMSSKIKELQANREEALRELLLESVKNNKLKDEFLASTSHELKTPLHGITGLSESLIDGDVGSLPEEVKSNIKLIQVCSKRLSILIDDILDFSKLKMGDINLNIKEIDINSVLKPVLKLLEPEIKSKDISIINNIANDEPYLYCDENRLYQIFFNLLGNSIKFTDTGYIVINSEIINNEMMRITISDTGIGVSENDLGKIFDIFSQAHQNRPNNNTGSGLGLAIVKKLVELQSGEVNVSSKAGIGSTFCFTLPYRKRNSINKLTKISNIEDGSLSIYNIKKHFQIKHELSNSREQYKKILIIDDEEINIQILVNFLNNKNYLVDISLDGHEGLEKILNNNYDLILLDIMMPHISGYDICREVRKKFSLTDLPILLLSARQQNQDMTIGLSAGANDYLPKPFEKSELLARIQNLLEMKLAINEIANVNTELKRTIHLANTDELTGINNRRAFFKIAKDEWYKCIENEIDFCILMMDIDNFKSLNDKYGHEVGDIFLKKASEAIHFSVRQNDIIGRIGGEEFIAFLHNTNIDEGIFIAERIRRSIDDIEVYYNGIGPIRRTISIGVSFNKNFNQEFEEYIKEADQLLYLAKNKGKNRVKFLSPV